MKWINWSSWIALLLNCSAIAIEIKSASSVLIDEVSVDGVPAEWVDSIKTAGSFLPGDEFDRLKVDRSINKTREFLENKGYANSKVTPDFKTDFENGQKRNVLRFHVELGVPIRISEISLLIENGQLPDAQRNQLRSSMEFKKGEVFDRDRVKEFRRNLEGSLAALNYVDSRVVKIETEAAADGVRLIFQIELGQRVVFSIQGNVFFARSELTLLLDEQRVVGLGRDYVNVLINRIRDRYFDYGFMQVKVTPYSFESIGGGPRKILFMIEEGQQNKIKNVIFDGNESFERETLESLYFKNASDRIQTRVYNEKMAEDAARAMIEELRKKGYLSAKLIAFKKEESARPGEVNLHIFMNEGLQTRIQKVEFKGQTVFSASQLIKFLGLEEGGALNLVQLEDGIDRIKREYRNQGFIKVSLLNEDKNQAVIYSEKNQYADLNFEILEGPQFRLGEVRVFGNEKTSRYVILREMQIRGNEIISEKKLNETEDRLRRLGIFSLVNLDLIDDPNDPLKKDLKVTVQEGPPGNLGYGVGYRNDLGVRVFGDLTYSNLWGQNQTWALLMSANRRIDDYQFFEYSGQMSYIWPWAFLGDTTFRPSVSAEKREYIQFDAQTYGFSANVDRSFWKAIGLSGGLTYTLEQIWQFNATVNPLDNQQIRVGSLTPQLRIDLRDNPVVPRRGFYLVTSFEYANHALGSQGDPIPVSFGRYQFRTDYYLDFIPHVVWYSSIRGGWVKNFANTSPNGVYNASVAVPLIKQFALGGEYSLRGYIQDELNNESQSIQGYQTFSNYRTQFDYSVTSALSIGPFLDAGGLNVNQFTLGALRYGTGVGLRYNTPVGPVNFDWGFKLFPQPGEQESVFYFSLGVI